MLSQRASLRFRIIIFILTGLMIAFAFVHSLMPADLSSQESSGFAELICRFLELFGISPVFSEGLIRKLAHFSEYTVIGGLMLSCAYSFNRPKPHVYAAYVLLSGLAAAFIDETIQLFTPGRAGMVTDIWIDFAGVFTGALIMWIFYALYCKIRFGGEKNVRS